MRMAGTGLGGQLLDAVESPHWYLFAQLLLLCESQLPSKYILFLSNPICLCHKMP